MRILFSSIEFEMVRLPLKKQLDINSTPFKPNFKIRRKKDLHMFTKR